MPPSFIRKFILSNKDKNMLTTTKKIIKTMSGEVIARKGQEVEITVKKDNAVYAIVRNIKTSKEYKMLTIRLHSVFEGFAPPPSIEELLEYSYWDRCLSLTGNSIEPDGLDAFDMPSYNYVFQLI